MERKALSALAAVVAAVGIFGGVLAGWPLGMPPEFVLTCMFLGCLSAVVSVALDPGE